MGAWALLWFFISVILKRNDVADIAWGLGFIVIGLVSQFLGNAVFAEPSIYSPKILVVLLVTIWALRLSIYIGLRNSKKGEDFRYKAWREEWGKSFYLRSFLQVYGLQVILALVISMPLIVAGAADVFPWHWLHIPATVLWLIGFYWQAIGDYQLSKFKSKAENKGEIIQSGLWQYSRHPNYFGEILMWWAIGLMVLPIPWGWLGFIGPITITYLLLRVSGVPMLEKKYKGNPQFESYKKKVPAVFPFKSF